MNFLNLEHPDSLMLLNVIYHRGTRESNWEDELDIVYRDLVTGEKKVKNIKNPPIDIYICKEEIGRAHV